MEEPKVTEDTGGTGGSSEEKPEVEEAVRGGEVVDDVGKVLSIMAIGLGTVLGVVICLQYSRKFFLVFFACSQCARNKGRSSCAVIAANAVATACAYRGCC